MKKSNLDKLIKITGDLEHLILNSESMPRSEVELRTSSVYMRLTEVVGAMMMDYDEMSGAIE